MHGEAGIAAYEQKKFRFTHTFGPKSTTGDIFAVQEASVLSVLKGFDATVMAYGSTGAGKTHTMIGSDAEPGILPLALDALFAHISSGDASYSLQLSALELLEERCVDLLHNRGAVVPRRAKGRPVLLRAEGGAGADQGAAPWVHPRCHGSSHDRRQLQARRLLALALRRPPPRRRCQADHGASGRRKPAAGGSQRWAAKRRWQGGRQAAHWGRRTRGRGGG